MSLTESLASKVSFHFPSSIDPSEMDWQSRWDCEEHRRRRLGFVA
jgi:hypothetical protein